VLGWSQRSHAALKSVSCGSWTKFRLKINKHKMLLESLETLIGFAVGFVIRYMDRRDGGAFNRCNQNMSSLYKHRFSMWFAFANQLYKFSALKVKVSDHPWSYCLTTAPPFAVVTRYSFRPDTRIRKFSALRSG
jgi:hypothetical protein